MSYATIMATAFEVEDVMLFAKELEEKGEIWLTDEETIDNLIFLLDAILKRISR